MEDLNVLRFIQDNIREGIRCAIAIMTDTYGSSPRKEGTTMGVDENGNISGTIGGGALEKEVIERSVDAVKKGENKRLTLELNDEGELHMQCGGKTEIYIKVFVPSDRIIIAGCGHIGKELYFLSNYLNFRTVMLDDREEFANEDIFSNSEEVLKGDIYENLKGINITSNDYIVIVTRGHKYDQDALEAVVNSNAKYIGMIGSKHKIIHTLNSLKDKGITEKSLNRVYAPVGLDISNGEPKEIAFAILGEILKVKNTGSGEHLKKVKFGGDFFEKETC
ncbi:XdhC family protein [Oceanirhabdus sp. W0125-5]|uniref:XdhC family protein n=1 Tax=Oceanirhabdus sp. W0125-5 TaxID=2999116 RepID=UPI0022F2CF03|nr:XdhC/CoxI family protein [Oceanirhabdus sp. W0125-5]WBW97864.1 XdhC/CoxI family protein [Oceanirhabdus sp. W0125-5]